MISVMKLVGTGNDFLFIDGRAAVSMARAELVRRLCDRHFGLGADGLVFVESRDEKIEWDFYNNDGSRAEMCGNATRCFGRWASLKMNRDSIDFATVAGPVRVDVRGDMVESYLEFVSANTAKKTVEGHELYWIDTGVPHFVMKVDSVEDAMKDLATIRKFRFHAEGGPRGANVTFLEIIGPTNFKTVTYERGVEDFTLSCGTGVIAAAAVGLTITETETNSARETDSALTPKRTTGTPNAERQTVSVTAPGGELTVRFETKGVTLIGPADKIFETEINEQDFK